MRTMLPLTAGELTLVLAPELGGAILSLGRGESEILRMASAKTIAKGEVRDTAAYPLVPYGNRIANGRFTFEGKKYQLRSNFPGPHPLHGVGWRRPWLAKRLSHCVAELSLVHRPQGFNALDWPFAFAARQHFAVNPVGFTLTIGMTNTDTRRAPAGIGLHPFFIRRGGERVAFRSGGAWSNDGDMLPEKRIKRQAYDFSVGRPVGETALDNDFYGWDGTAIIEDAERRRRLILTADPVFGSLRVFTPEGRDFFAVEPATHMVDAINRTGEAGNGLVILEPGESLEGRIALRIEDLS